MTEAAKDTQGITGWHTSSYTAGEPGTCVEQGLHPDGRVAVRDTKHGKGSPIVSFEASDWKAFVASL